MFKTIALFGVLTALVGTATASSANRSDECRSIQRKFSLAEPVQLSEPCAATVVVQTRINGRPPYDSQGGNGGSILIDYGWNAAVRITQRHNVIRVTAVTASPRPQRLLIWFQPQTGPN